MAHCLSNNETMRTPLLSLPPDSRAGEGAPRTVDHAVIGGVVAVVVFAMLCLLIVLGRYFARHKGKLDFCFFLITKVYLGKIIIY